METPVRPTNNCDENSTPTVKSGARQGLQRRVLRKQIKEVLLRFKFNELITDVILDLFDLQPIEVQEKLKEYKLPSNKFSVASLLHNRSQAFDVPNLEDMYHSLLLYRTAFGSKQKKWVVVNLLEPAEDVTVSTDEKVIRLNILQGLRIKGLNAVVKVILHDNLVWVMIIEKKLVRRKGIRLMKPVFICYEAGLPYIFTASKISGVVMESILRAMKYKKHKLRNLEGKDIKSLLTLLKHRVLNGSTQIVPYSQAAQITMGHRYIDVSNKKARETYIDKVFATKDPIHLGRFHCNAEAVWRNESVQEMIGEPFHIAMTIKSKDLVGTIKHMVSENMINTPLPEYVVQIVRSAKNKVFMKTVQN